MKKFITQKQLDLLLKLLLRLQDSSPPNINRIANSLFIQLSKYRFSSSADLEEIKF